MTDDPAACARPTSCATIRRLAQASRRVVAICNHCHTPANFIGKSAPKAPKYYFKGPEQRLVYPWAKELKVEKILAYDDQAQ